MIKTHAPSLHFAMQYGMQGTARAMLKSAFGLTTERDLDNKLMNLGSADIGTLVDIDRKIRGMLV